MSIFDGKRLPVSTFRLDVERMRQGWYSDKYFLTMVSVLSELARQQYRFGGTCPALSDLGIDVTDIRNGDIEVEMQWFTRRQPFAVVVGIDKCLAMLKTCAGYVDSSGAWVDTFNTLEIDAVQDGTVVAFDGDPARVRPVLRVRGRYRDFGLLETPTLGALTRGSRIATNVYEVLEAAGGKDVLFFPARFDAHEVQAADGYAYHIAVQSYNLRNRAKAQSIVSTNEQGDWWGGDGRGTIAHAGIACFLGDTAEAMMAFCLAMPAAVPRIALVDFNNDCIGTSLAVMRRMFAAYRERIDAGREEEARRYVLYAVRPDTSGNLRDKSVVAFGDSRLDNGVCPRLCFKLRAAVDSAWNAWDLPASWHERARQWCRAVRLTVTGGFNPEKIRAFEKMGVPVDIYGVGSSLLSNCSAHGTNTDFTADIVRVRIDGVWHPMAKVGRQAGENPDLKPVTNLPD